MQGPKRDPYLWLHLVGLAALPLCAELCLLGLAAGDPLLPGGWDWLLVGLLGTAPIAAMQWLRPFYPFSIALVSLRADSLDDTQQRILQRWSSWEPKAIALVSTVLVLWGLQWLDRLSPVAAEIAPLDNRSLGLLVAWLGTLIGNGLLAIAAAALWVLLTPTAAFEAIEPFPLGNVPGAFLRPSLRLTRLLSPLAESAATAPPQTPDTTETTDPTETTETTDPTEAAMAEAAMAEAADETAADLTEFPEATAPPITEAAPIAQAPVEVAIDPEPTPDEPAATSDASEAIVTAEAPTEAAIGEETTSDIAPAETLAGDIGEDSGRDASDPSAVDGGHHDDHHDDGDANGRDD